MAKALAREVGYVYVDSGAMYRAVTLYALRHGMASREKGVDGPTLIAALPNIDIAFTVAPDGSQHTLLNGEDVEAEIRGMEVSSLVSPVAVIPEVRHRLVALQQAYGKEKGIVMDGRDIGTTVFPGAEMKVFVEASPEVRAERRLKELRQKGDTTTTFEDVLENVRERDHIDTTRKESPLRKADDAFLLSNDHLTLDEQLKVLTDRFEKLLANRVKS